jgi:Tfp pilus assembly protein PilF
MIDLASASPSGFLVRATRYLGSDQPERAQREIEALVTGEQQDPTAWLYHATVMADLKQCDRAIEALERTLELAEASDTRFEVFTVAKYERAHTLLGHCLAASGDATGAEQELRRALEINPDSIMALRTLASVYAEQGRETEARELLGRVRAIQIES